MEKNNPLYIGYDKSNDGNNGKKIIHYILDVMIVMLMMRKKNDSLYIGYKESNDGDNGKKQSIICWI